MSFRSFLRLGAAAVLALVFSTTVALAQQYDHDRDREYDRHDDHDHAYDHDRHDHDRGWDHHYAEHDRDLHEWYRANYHHLPPGLARRDHLPPGLERQIVVQGFVPVELRGRMQPCPHEVEAFLPPPPPGHMHVFIGGNLVLVNRANFQIVDVFHFNL
jgi:Ni/Co efflux regulator RcnB